MDYNNTILFKYITPDFEKSNKERIVEGYASTYDIDRQYEVITPQALQKAVDALLSTNTTVFYEHKHEQFPVGRIVDAKVDDKGLWIKVLISQTANEVWTLVQEGILNKFSIGGKVLDHYKKFDKKLGRDLTYITNMELYEVSIVGLPANQYAQFHQSKSLCGAMLKALEGREKLNNVLQTLEGKEGEKKVEDIKIEKQAIVEQPKVEDTIIPKIEKSIEPVKEETPIIEVKKELTKEEVEALVEKSKDKEAPKTEKQAVEADKVPKENQDDATNEYYYYADVTKTMDELKNSLSEILAVVKDIQTKMSIVPVKEEVKPIEMPKSLDIKEVESVVLKALDDKLGKIRLVPSRKGTIIKSDLEFDKKDENDDDDDNEILLNEKKFDALPKEKQNEIKHKALKSIFSK
jgi:HK97 family phage prohead protease